MALEPLVPLGRWREAEAILADVEPGGQEGTGGTWNGLFAGIIAVRAGRLDEAQELLRIRRDAAQLVTDAAFAGNLAGGLIELALAEGRLADGRVARRREPRLAGRLRTTSGSGSRVLRLGVRVEAEIALVARARRDRESEEAARVLGVTRVERLRELLATFDDGTSPVFAEARGNRALAEAEVTRLLDRPDPAAWNSAGERFIEPRRPYELAMCRLREAEALLAIRAPRADAAAALAEAQALATEIGAGPLADAIAGLARMARLELPSARVVDAAAGAGPGTESPATDEGGEVEDPFGLTPREREVLGLLVAGQTNRRIAETLFISESTASVHVSNIIGKLGVTNRAEAAVTAVRSGLAR